MKYPAWRALRKSIAKGRPVSDIYGFDRGAPIDRLYIEEFLNKNRGAIRGACLELLNSDYTVRFGGKQVTKIDVLDIDPANNSATVHGDLRDLESIKNSTYDCVILTQVLQFIDDYEVAIKECHRILKPGGVVLATVPALSRSDVASGSDRDFWRFTPAGAQYIFGKVFGLKNIKVDGCGNVLTGLGFWVGLAQQDLSPTDFDYDDPNFPILVTVRATKK